MDAFLQQQEKRHRSAADVPPERFFFRAGKPFDHAAHSFAFRSYLLLYKIRVQREIRA
jgi:hypothetical protein